MGLADFIATNKQAILDEWDQFAETLRATTGMSDEQLRDSAAALLDQLAEAMRASQSAGEQKRKSRGELDRPPGTDGDSAAQSHGNSRFADGFDVAEMAAEFRALRASVIRLWRQKGDQDADAVDDLIRFGEAMDQALAESLSRFDRRLRRTRELFLGTLAHDVRTPLQAIMLGAQVMQRGDLSPEQQVATSARVLASGRRMQQIVDDLFDVMTARLHGELSLHPSDGDMRELCNSVLEEMRLLHRDRRFTLDATGQATGCWDRGRICQAVSNLVGNAVKHGAADGPVAVRILADDDQLRVEVNNQGEPIAPDRIRKIFEPLAQGHLEDIDSDRSRGLGLGLYITSSIARAHHGRVDVVSSRERGTTFALVVPRRVDHTAK